jgi:hypothetical protein
VPKFDITKLNVAIDKLLETTENPRHRFLLQSYSRHRYLEIAGRYEEIFAPDMMSMDPVYHFHAGGNDIVLRGQDKVKSLYRMWAETNQSIFFIESEEHCGRGPLRCFRRHHFLPASIGKGPQAVEVVGSSP